MRVGVPLLVVGLAILTSAPLLQGATLSASPESGVMRTSRGDEGTDSSPSTMNQLATSTKKFFAGVQEAITPKSVVHKTTVKYYTPGTSAKHRTTHKSWFGSWFHPKESSP